MKYIRTPEDPRHTGIIAADDRYPGTHTGLRSSWLNIGPDSVFAKYGLGNLSSSKLEISEDTYEPGGCTFTHAHPEREQAFYIITGQAAVTVGNEEKVIGPRSVALIPPGTPHSFRVLGDKPLTLLVISSYL